MGLLGTALEAYVRNLRLRRERPDVFVVPTTLNYQLVLEAETLIDDHLKEAGKSRYIIEDDEFSKPRRLLDFVQRLFALDSRIHLVFSRPLDTFGNLVDDEGRSLDHRGRPIDRSRYVLRGGEPVFDGQRDREYVREVGRSIVEAYHRETVVNSTNAAAHMVFSWLRERAEGLDLFRLLRTGGPDESMTMAEAHNRLDRILSVLRRMADDGRIRLDETVGSGDAARVLDEALAHLASYHSRPALVRRGDRLFHVDRNLLLYYQNRLSTFDIKALEAAA
jgi:glycerol-3-phosphate O-acyltransferase